jgi:hypothetical protein
MREKLAAIVCDELMLTGDWCSPLQFETPSAQWFGSVTREGELQVFINIIVTTKKHNYTSVIPWSTILKLCLNKTSNE